MIRSVTTKGEAATTYVQTIHGPKTRQPKQTLAAHSIHKQVLAGKHGLADSLRLGLHGHVGGTGEKSVLAHGPGRAAVDVQGDDVAHERGAEGQPSRACVGRFRHPAARKELLHGELDVALELDGAGHVYHGAGLGAHGAAGLEVHVEDGIGVAVSDVVAAAGE